MVLAPHLMKVICNSYRGLSYALGEGQCALLHWAVGPGEEGMGGLCFSVEIGLHIHNFRRGWGGPWTFLTGLVVNLNHPGGMWECHLWVPSGKGRLVCSLVKPGLTGEAVAVLGPPLSGCIWDSGSPSFLGVSVMVSSWPLSAWTSGYL